MLCLKITMKNSKMNLFIYMHKSEKSAIKEISIIRMLTDFFMHIFFALKGRDSRKKKVVKKPKRRLDPII